MQNYIPPEQLDARVRIAKRKRPTPTGDSPLQELLISHLMEHVEGPAEGAKEYQHLREKVYFAHSRKALTRAPRSIDTSERKRILLIIACCCSHTQDGEEEKGLADAASFERCWQRGATRT